jgi:hypothetical protein
LVVVTLRFMNSNLRTFLFTWLVLAVSASIGRAMEGRFSQSLSSDEVAATGLARLSSDQQAALDALVRRDLALAANTPSTESRPARFSARLSADERRVTGLTRLNTAELAQVDAFVKRFSAPPAPPSSSPSSAVSTAGATDSSLVKVTSWRRKPEIHGMMSLMYGVGSHGYSERGGAMVLTYDDPNRNFSVAFGYSELHTTGDFLRCGYGYDNWGYYDRGFDPFFPYR